MKTIVVDLTPLLPGGANGGAKGFVLDLLRHLGRIAPATDFILLTQASAHAELAQLDAPNIRRVMAIGGSAPTGRASRAAVLDRVLAHVPLRLAVVAGRTASRLVSLLKRRRSHSLMENLQADLLFCPFTAPTFARAGIPLVSIIYDLQYKAYPEFFSIADAAHRSRTFAEACKRADRLVAISEFSRGEAIAEGSLDPAFITAIPLQISAHVLAAPSDDGDATLARLGLIDRNYLIYPANFWKHKNHEMLLVAFAMARQRGLRDEIRLVCTGAGRERLEALTGMAAQMGLGTRVVFPGYLPDSALMALMRRSAGLIFPSLYEGFGLPVVEAMAIGVPVACGHVASVPEIAGDAAILFDPRVPDEIAAAMIALTCDPDLTRRLVAAGFERARLFSNPRAMAENYLAVFKDVVASRARQRMPAS